MFEIQHAALREAQREIERLKAQHYGVWLGAGRPGGWGLMARLRRLWGGRPPRADEGPRGAVVDEQCA